MRLASHPQCQSSTALSLLKAFRVLRKIFPLGVAALTDLPVCCNFSLLCCPLFQYQGKTAMFYHGAWFLWLPIQKADVQQLVNDWVKLTGNCGGVYLELQKFNNLTKKKNFYSEDFFFLGSCCYFVGTKNCSGDNFKPLCEKSVSVSCIFKLRLPQNFLMKT